VIEKKKTLFKEEIQTFYRRRYSSEQRMLFPPATSAGQAKISPE
jgi:hypothetical protein